MSSPNESPLVIQIPVTWSDKPIEIKVSHFIAITAVVSVSVLAYFLLV